MFCVKCRDSSKKSSDRGKGRPIRCKELCNTHIKGQFIVTEWSEECPCSFAVLHLQGKEITFVHHLCKVKKHFSPSRLSKWSSGECSPITSLKVLTRRSWGTQDLMCAQHWSNAARNRIATGAQGMLSTPWNSAHCLPRLVAGWWESMATILLQHTNQKED